MKKILFILCVIAALLIPVTGQSLTFNTDTLLTGSTPTSTSPWLTLTFSDAGDSAVRLDIASSLEVSSEFISNIVFNVDPSLTLSGLSFGTGIKTAGSFDLPTIGKTAPNEQNITPARYFDIALEFSTANNANQRFDASDILTYSITYAGTGSFDANSFEYFNIMSDPEKGGFYVLAHFQGIPTGEGSGKLGDKVSGVPEPSTLLLLGAGLVGFGILGRRKFKG